MERCGTEDIRVKCNAANTVFNANCGLEAIQVWLPFLPHTELCQDLSTNKAVYTKLHLELDRRDL